MEIGSTVQHVNLKFVKIWLITEKYNLRTTCEIHYALIIHEIR